MGAIRRTLAEAGSPLGSDGEGLVERSAGGSLEDEFGFTLQGPAGEGSALLETIDDIIVESTNQDIRHGVFPFCRQL